MTGSSQLSALAIPQRRTTFGGVDLILKGSLGKAKTAMT
jgi:hypothetical protein